MKLFDFLVGNAVLVKTDMQTSAQLLISSIKENHHSQETGPSTQENDWWPTERTWKTYTVTFTNGAKKEYGSLNDIEIIF